MRWTHLSLIPLALGVGLLLSPGAPTPAADEEGPALAPAADSLDDGPHVYWQDDTRAVVFYLCGGRAPIARLEARDTLAFTGFCTDSTTEYRVPARPPRPHRDTWTRVPRFLAVSDIHGDYDALSTFLQRAGVVDSAGTWTWGDGHLVVVGDMVDRGAQVTEVLWFLHRLEQEAQRAGGRVHVVLGNHEMMVMRDDLRYVNERYTTGIVRYWGIRYPDLFGPDMELGRWLRSKPVVLKLNDVLFVHGGLAPELATRGLGITTVNTRFRESLDLSSITVALSDTARLLLGNSGPLWYRGYLTARSGLYPETTVEELDAVLKYYGAKAVVVGHTEIGQVARLREGRVFAIDVDVELLGGFQGLLWENGVFSVVSGMGTVLPLP
jgi:hypothetical protein